MNKFGLLDNDETTETPARLSFAEKLAAFPPAAPRQPIDIAAMDAAVAPHGFTSREAPTNPSSGIASSTQSRRRRITAVEPTRHLAIRLTLTQYERFVAYADAHKLTYHDALGQLLDECSTE